MIWNLINKPEVTLENCFLLVFIYNNNLTKKNANECSNDTC